MRHEQKRDKKLPPEFICLTCQVPLANINTALAHALKTGHGRDEKPTLLAITA